MGKKYFIIQSKITCFTSKMDSILPVNYNIMVDPIWFVTSIESQGLWQCYVSASSLLMLRFCSRGMYFYLKGRFVSTTSIIPSVLTHSSPLQNREILTTELISKIFEESVSDTKIIMEILFELMTWRNDGIYMSFF